MAYVEGTECAGKKGDAEPGRRARSLPVGGQTEVLHRDGQGRPPEEDDLRREHRAGSRAARGPAWPNLEGRERSGRLGRGRGPGHTGRCGERAGSRMALGLSENRARYSGV